MSEKCDLGGTIRRGGQLFCWLATADELSAHGRQLHRMMKHGKMPTACSWRQVMHNSWRLAVLTAGRCYSWQRVPQWAADPRCACAVRHAVRHAVLCPTLCSTLCCASRCAVPHAALPALEAAVLLPKRRVSSSHDLSSMRRASSLRP